MGYPLPAVPARGILCDLYTAVADHDGYSLLDSLPAPGQRVAAGGGSNLDAHRDRTRSQVRMLLSFQRPPSLSKGGSSGEVAGPASADALRAHQEL